MVVRGIHHIGVAVRDLPEALSRWTSLLGAAAGPVEENAVWGVRLAELRFAAGMVIELLAPIGDSSPVAKFLAVRGGGIHHLALEVEDIEAAMAEMRRQGLVFVTDTPRPGAGGSLTAFVHPRSLDGVLLELRQSSSSGPTETV
jgi:methylmalonyl-CoA epimerase